MLLSSLPPVFRAKRSAKALVWLFALQERSAVLFSVHLHVRKGPAKRRTGFLHCKKGELWFFPPVCACEKAEKTIGLRICHPTGHDAAFLLTGGCGELMSNRSIIVYRLLYGFLFLLYPPCHRSRTSSGPCANGHDIVVRIVPQVP